MIVLDTHIWLWWVNQNVDFLAPKRKEQIELSDIVAVSAISCFKVGAMVIPLTRPEKLLKTITKGANICFKNIL